jgi:hypothetical protein
MISELHEQMLTAWLKCEGYDSDDTVTTEALISSLDNAVDAYCASVLNERGL